MNEKNKKVIIRRFDGVRCLVLVRKSPANPAHWIFEVTVMPAVGGRYDYTFKRYACGNYYWIDSFWGDAVGTRIKSWFPAWDLRKFLAAHSGEEIR